MKPLKTQKEAKLVIRRNLRGIAKKAAISRNILIKFYPSATITAGYLARIVDEVVSLNDMIRDFKE